MFEAKLQTICRYVSIAFFAIFPAASFAAVSDIFITEIMYDLEGADSDREWIEIVNGGSEPITLVGGSGAESFRIYEEHGSTKHNHTLSPDAYQGTMTLGAGEYAVIAQDGARFLADHPSYTGTLLVSSAMSLGNTSQIEGLRIGSEEAVWSRVAYSNATGGNGDGESLQLVNGQWIAATPTPGTANEANASQSSQSSGASSSSEAPKSLAPSVPEPKFRAYAGEDRTAFVGAPVKFEGKVFGYENREIEGGRYLWSFGDGISQEGNPIEHVYRFPGTYLLSLSVSSNAEAASDYLRVTVVPNTVFISEIAPGENGFLELANPSKEIVRLDLWMLRNETTGVSDILPSGMMLGANSAVAIPLSRLKIFNGISAGVHTITLNFPNNSPVFRVVVNGSIGEGESIIFDQQGNGVKSIKPSPGVLPQTPAVAPKSSLSTTGSSPAKNVTPAIATAGNPPQETRRDASEEPSSYVASASFASIPFMAAVALSILGAVGFFFIQKFIL